MGTPLYFKPAPEPSNILWENQFTPKVERYRKATNVLLVIAIALMI
jgi:hypothetical protein